MKFNDFLIGIIIYLIGLFSILFTVLALLRLNISDEVAIIVVLTYLLIIPMVICTRIILRSVRGPLKLDRVEAKIKDLF